MRKTAKLFSVFLTLSVIISAAVFLCSCEKINKYEFLPSDQVVLTLPGSSILNVPYAMETVHYGNEYADFYIEDYVKESERNRAVTFTMQVLDYIKPENKITCYISRYVGTSIDYDDSVMYLSEKDVKTYDHLINTVTVAFEGKLPYGLVYGLARKINKDNGWGLNMPKGTKSGVKNYLNRNKSYADLQAPELIKETSKNYKKARKAALSLCDFIDEKENLLLFCKNYTFAKFEEYKKAWAASLGVTCEDGLDCAISFVSNLNDEFIIRAKNIDIFLPLDHVDYIYFYYKNEYNLNLFDYKKTYNDLKIYLQASLNAIDKSTPELNELIEKKDKLSLHFSKSSEVIVDKNSGYTSSLSYVFTLYLFHRFSIGRMDKISADLNAVLTYFNLKYCYIDYLFDKEALNNPDFPLSDEVKRRYEFIYEKFPDLKYDTFEDYAYFLQVNINARAYLSGTSTDMTDGYYDSSFVLYIGDHYGVEAFYAMNNGESFETAVGISESEATDNWLNYIKEFFES